MKKILLVVLLLVIANEAYGDEKKCLAENIILRQEVKVRQVG